MVLAARDGPYAQAADTEERERCGGYQPNAPELTAVIGRLRALAMKPPASRRKTGYDSFLAALEKETLAFGKPVVYVHGDTHIFRIDKPLVDSRTGALDKSVAQYWKEHYDLRSILETNWPTLGPKVANKINVYVGDADTYFLNMGVHMLENFLKSAKNPAWTGEVVFQPMAPHCWGPSLRELIPKMAAQVDKSAPAGTDMRSWKY